MCLINIYVVLYIFISQIQDHLTSPQFENKVDTQEAGNEGLVSPSYFVTSLVGSGQEKLIGVRVSQITEIEYDELGEEVGKALHFLSL